MFTNVHGSHFASVKPKSRCKVTRNKFQKQLNDVVSHFTSVSLSLAPSVVINFWCSLKIT
jgi:hypothetical protein